jgi:hypothetical protein
MKMEQRLNRSWTLAILYSAGAGLALPQYARDLLWRGHVRVRGKIWCAPGVGCT